MKALVAVGTDRRLRSLSSTTPAQLAPVANRPALCYALDAIRKAGVDEACLVVGAGQRDVERAVGRGFDYGLDISYLRQDAPLGLGHCALIAREFLGDEDFMLYQGGVVLPDGIEDLVAKFRDQGADAMSLADEAGAQLGVHLFSPAVHQAVLAIRPRWNNTRDITDAIRWLADRGHVTGQHVTGGTWHDTGTAEGLLACNRTILGRIQAAVHGTVDDASELSGAVIVEEGAQVSRSRITGPVVIGSYARVEDAVIGPGTSVGADCVISGAQIESSILLSGAEVHRVRRISESVIGRGASVRPAPAGPGARRLILGDHSQILVEP